ncbi:hypothetical protein MMC15_002862 [Xylographa vitiligo]|nr:hypothetical protein [Xylographa vitiligo]
MTQLASRLRCCDASGISSTNDIRLLCIAAHNAFDPVLLTQRSVSSAISLQRRYVGAVSPSIRVGSAPKRKRTAGSNPMQASTESKTPEKVFVVLHEEEEQDTPLSHEILGAYRSLQDANAAAYDFWEENYSGHDELFEKIKRGDEIPDEARILYKGVKKDGTMHNLCVDEDGARSEILVKWLMLQ